MAGQRGRRILFLDKEDGVTEQASSEDARSDVSVHRRRPFKRRGIGSMVRDQVMGQVRDATSRVS